MVIEVPEELKDFGEAVLRVVTMVAPGMTAGAGGKALDYARVERDSACQSAAATSRLPARASSVCA
jgi:hypothetical protein